MANTFLSSKQISIGASVYEKSMQKVAKSLLDYYDDKIALPEDVVTMDVGDENGAQLHHRIPCAHQLVLGAFTAVHQIPGFGPRQAKRQARDVA